MTNEGYMFNLLCNMVAAYKREEDITPYLDCAEVMTLTSEGSSEV